MKCLSLSPTGCMMLTSYLTSLCLSFLIFKSGILLVYLLHRFMRIELVKVKCLEHYLPHSKCLNVSYYYYSSSLFILIYTILSRIRYTHLLGVWGKVRVTGINLFCQLPHGTEFVNVTLHSSGGEPLSPHYLPHWNCHFGDGVQAVSVLEDWLNL